MTEIPNINLSENIEVSAKFIEEKKGFRKYKKNCQVSDNYKLNRINQTFEHVRKIHSEVFPLGRWKMNILDVFNLLDDIVDQSDPDTRRKQLTHAIQTAQSCRKLYPEKDWFHLLGFIHDLGKVLTHHKMHGLPQWDVTGDTFPVGCSFSDKCIYSEYFQLNPDSMNEAYSSKLGIYEEKIGFDNILMSFGHDEYMYQVLKNNRCLLPDEALYIVRFHSFYPWHQEEAYSYLASDKDWKMLPLLREFQRCDLYSKTEEEVDISSMLPYYVGLLNKYFPSEILSW